MTEGQVFTKPIKPVQTSIWTFQKFMTSSIVWSADYIFSYMYRICTISNLFDFHERQWLKLSDILFWEKMSDSSEKIRARPTFNCFNIRTVKVRTSTPTVRGQSGVFQIILSWENLEFRSYIIYVILQGPQISYHIRAKWTRVSPV